MKLMRKFVTSSVVIGSVLMPVSGVLANSTTISTSGADSIQDVSVSNAVHFTQTSSNVTIAVSSNDQQSYTGEILASKNTSIGDLASGSASNTNDAVTTVMHNSPAVTQLPVGGQGDGIAAPLAGATPLGGRGNVLGASSSPSSALLPAVGASQAIDVSALRDAWNAHGTAAITEVAKGTQGFTAMALLVAVALSVLSGLGSAVYVRRKEGKI